MENPAAWGEQAMDNSPVDIQEKRKLHLGVDEATGEILAAVVTTNDFHDGEVLGDVLEQVEGELEQVSADGAYDQRQCCDRFSQHGAKPVIPPRKDAFPTSLRWPKPTRSSTKTAP